MSVLFAIIAISSAMPIAVEQSSTVAQYNPNFVEDQEALKQKLIMSRGYGSAGMQFNSMYYLNHYAKSQQLLLKQQQEQEKLQQKDHKTTKKTKATLATTKSPPKAKRPFVVPQLFVSLGWGPMG